MEICVCVKRVPTVGGTIAVTPDGLEVDTTMSGFTVSPHEECAVEEAVQIIERLGADSAGPRGGSAARAAGSSAGAGGAGGVGGSGSAGGTRSGGVTVLTLGPPEAAEQLRDMLALGASRAILLQTDGAEWGPIATAAAIADAVRDGGYDLLLFGNEAADTGGYQVPVRVAHALGLPCVTGIKKLAISADRLRARREYRGTEELFELPLPAVVSVKEGINLPRYPSLPGRLRAKRAAIDTIEPRQATDNLRKERLRVPEGSHQRAQILGTGIDAVPALVNLLNDLGVLP
jgi:electron transfer flavoprotein beta subunit